MLAGLATGGGVGGLAALFGQRHDAHAHEWAESQILNSVREWAQDAGMALPNITPERTKEKDFGKIVVRASGTGGISQVGSPSASLADSADFKEAVDAAGLPDSNGGFFYFDLKNAIPLIEGFAGLSGTKIPANVSENLRPLRSFLSWSGGSGDSRTFDAFLEIK